MRQGQFLTSLGLQPRLDKLLSAASTSRRDDMQAGARRLVDPLGMGKEYQVMGVVGGGKDDEEVYPFISDPPRSKS